MIDQVPLRELDFGEIGRQVGRSAEELALIQSIEYFGPLSSAFLEHIQDKGWQHRLKNLDAEVAENVGVDPPDRLKCNPPLLRHPLEYQHFSILQCFPKSLTP